MFWTTAVDILPELQHVAKNASWLCRPDDTMLGK